jgi:hypothetical protein
MVQMHEFWWCRVGGLECRYLAFFFFSRADQLPLSSAQLTFFLHFKSSCLSLFLPQLSSLKVLFLSITFGFITNAHNYHHNERAHAALEHSMLNWSLGGIFVCTQVHCKARQGRPESCREILLPSQDFLARSLFCSVQRCSVYAIKSTHDQIFE